MNQLKTLSMRIRGAKTELQEAGEDTEGMADSTAKMRKNILGLTGVDIMLDSKNFKSTYQIMSEIANVWSDLSDIDRASLLEQLAGKTRANQVSALLSNWTIAEKSLQSALNSTGIAVNENNIYLDSIQGRIAALKASAQGLATDVIDENWIKWIVSAGDGTVRAFDWLMTIDDIGIKKAIEWLSNLINSSEKLSNSPIFAEMSSRLDMLEKYVDIFGKLPSLISAVTAAVSVLRKQTSFLPTNFLGKRVDKNTYNKELVGGVDSSVFENFNNNVLDNAESDEYKRLMSYVDASSPMFKKAKNSLDDYLASCAQLSKQASASDYERFIQENTQDRYSGLRGMKRFLNDYKQQGHDDETIDVTPSINTEEVEQNIAEIAQDGQSFFEEMVSNGIENGLDNTTVIKHWGFQAKKTQSRKQRRAQSQAQEKERENYRSMTGDSSSDVNFTDGVQTINQVEVDHAQVTEITEQINDLIPEFTLEFKPKVDEQQVSDTVNTASDNIVSDVESESNGADVANNVNEQVQNVVETMEDAEETSEGVAEAADAIASRTRGATKAQKALVVAMSGMNPEFAKWVSQNPNATMAQYAGKLIKTKVAQFGAQAAHAALNAAMSYGISLVATGLISQFAAAINYYKDLAEAGQEAAEQFSQSTEDLNDLIDKFREYKDELNSGKLTESEAYDTRSKLLDLQRQMIDTYGEEVNGIDLVNGSLESQIKLMERLGGQKASEFLSDNAAAIDKAEKALNNPRWFAPKWASTSAQENLFANDYSIDAFELSYLVTPDKPNYKGEDAVEDITNEISRIVKKSGLTYENGYLTAVNMTDTEAIEAWQTLSTELRKSTLIDNSEVQTLLNQISEEIKDLNDDTYQNNLKIKEQASVARIMDNDDYLATYNNVTEEIENYREAIASGDQLLAANSLKTLENLKDIISNDSTMDTWVQEYILNLFDSVSQQMNESEYEKLFKDDSSGTKAAAQSVINKYFPGMDDQTIKAVQAGTEEYNELMKLVDDSPVDSIEELVNAWVKLGLVETNTASETTQTVKSFEQQLEDVSKTVSNVDAVDSAMKTLMGGGELDYSTITSLLKAYPELIDDIEQTQTGYKVSAKALQKMRKVQLSDMLKSTNENILEAQKEVQRLNEENEKFTQKINNNNSLVKNVKDYNKELSTTSDKIVKLQNAVQLYEYAEENNYRKRIKDTKALADKAVHQGNAKDLGKYVAELKELQGFYDSIAEKAGTSDYQEMNSLLGDNQNYYNQIIAAQKQEGLVLSENNGLVAAQGLTYEDIIKQNEAYRKKIEENNKQVKKQNQYIKEQRFLWNAQAAGIPDYVEQIKDLYQKGTSGSDLLQEMKDQYEQYGSIAADTVTEFMDQVPNWDEYITIDENGVVKMIDDTYDAALDEITGYTDKIRELNDTEGLATVGKDVDGTKGVLQTLFKQYRRSGIDVEYQEDANFLTNLKNLRNALENAGRLDGYVADTLDNLEIEYGSYNKTEMTKNITNLTNDAVKLHENIVDFNSKVSEWQKQLDNGEISNNEFATLYNNALNGIKNIKGYSADDQKSIEGYLKTNYQQIQDMNQRNYDDEKTLLDNQLEDRAISYLTYQKDLAAINEKYYGPNGVLGQTEDGKKQYETNLREVSKISKEAYDDIVSRLDSAVSYGTIIDPNLIDDIKEAFGDNIPETVQQALQKAVTGGTLNEVDILPIVQSLSNALLTGVDLTDAINDNKSKVTSAFEYEKEQLDNQLEAGLISSDDYIDEYTKLWEKYYKDKKEFAKEDLQTQKDILEAYKSEIQKQIDGLDAMSELQAQPYQDEIDALNDVQDEYDKMMDKRIKALNKEKEKLEEQNKEREKANDIQDKYLAMQKASVKKYIVLTNHGWEAQADSEEYEQAKKEYEDAKQDSVTDAIEKQIDALEKEKEARDESIQTEIEEREKQIKQIEAPINNLTRVLTALLAQQYNLDPDFIAQLLSSADGTTALEALNKKMTFSQSQASAAGVDVPDDTLTTSDAQKMVDGLAEENNRTTEEVAKNIGLDLNNSNSTAAETTKSNNTTAPQDDVVTANTQATEALTEEMKKSNDNAEKQNADSKSDDNKAKDITVGGYNLVADPKTGKLTKKPVTINGEPVEGLGHKVNLTTKAEHDKNKADYQKALESGTFTGSFADYMRQQRARKRDIVPITEATGGEAKIVAQAIQAFTGSANIPVNSNIKTNQLIEPADVVQVNTQPAFNCTINIEGSADEKTVEKFRSVCENEINGYFQYLNNTMNSTLVRSRYSK